MSPGDDSYDEPYFYVTPWPAPTDITLASLAGGGRWHIEDWTGAVLTANALTASRPEEQVEQAVKFLESALAATRKLFK